MATIPQRTTANTAAEHVSDHNALHTFVGDVATSVATQMNERARRTSVEHDLASFTNTSNNILASFTIPGGTAAGGHEYRFRAWGELQNNSGGNSDITFQVFRAGASKEHFGAITVPTSADFRAWEVVFTQFMDNDFSLNMLSTLRIGALKTAGVIQGNNLADRVGWRQESLTSVDWASDMVFDLRAQWTVSATTRVQGYDLHKTLTTPG